MGRRRSTIDDYESYTRVHLVPFFGNQPMSRITPLSVERYVSHEIEAGSAVKSVYNYLVLLNTLFRYAMRHGAVTVNPVALIDRPKRRPTTDIRYLTTGELQTLLEQVPSDILGPTERVVYLTAALTGLRRGELVALEWKDIDFGARLIRVRRTFSHGRVGPLKTHRSSRSVPLAARVAEALSAHRERSLFCGRHDLVFAHPGTGKLYDPSKLRKRFVRAAERAGLKGTRFHDLRHTFGTELAAAGAPMRSIQAWMGHVDFPTTSIYVDYAPEPSRATAYVDRAFERIEEPRAAGSRRGR